MAARYQAAEIRERVNIVDLVGRYVELRRKGTDWKGLCPFHHEKTPSLNVRPSRNTWKCFGCGAGGDVISFVMEIEGKTFPEAMQLLADLYGVSPSAAANHISDVARKLRKERQEKSAQDDRRRTEGALRLVEESRPIETGDPVDLYLRGRGLRPLASTWPSSLRRAVLKHPQDGKRHPAMLAVVTDAQSGMTIAVHRTFLTEDGKKAHVSPVKLSLGPIGGGVVRLGIDSEKIAIAEGIESAIGAGMAFGLVPWAALSAGNMERVLVPPSVRSVLICADSDANLVGRKAAIKLRASLKQQQLMQQRLIEVNLTLPPPGRADFADFG